MPHGLLVAALRAERLANSGRFSPAEPACSKRVANSRTRSWRPRVSRRPIPRPAAPLRDRSDIFLVTKIRLPSARHRSAVSREASFLTTACGSASRTGGKGSAAALLLLRRFGLLLRRFRGGFFPGASSLEHVHH